MMNITLNTEEPHSHHITIHRPTPLTIGQAAQRDFEAVLKRHYICPHLLGEENLKRLYSYFTCRKFSSPSDFKSVQELLTRFFMWEIPTETKHFYETTPAD